ncbi:MAG: 1-acyl-sn-glycerol-3-phosphate acyltransferase [Gammaproteobacteria bacterium]|nr:1-acyl-sn-glycerol-3-phosphate acyltransferase [Gammaproteobacteria bacterium]
MKQQNTYKASRQHVAWIQLLTAIYTFWRSLRIIWIAYVGANKQSRIDEQTHLWAKNLLLPTGLKINIHNPHDQEFSKDKRIILMCNHSCLYDIPVSFVAVPGSIRMLTKKELFKIPVLGTALTKGGFVSIDRQNSKQARKDLKCAKAELEKGVMLWVAPEGTRSRDGRIHRFKKGGFHLAIETKATIVPIGIRGINKVLPSNTFDLTINGEIDVCIGKEFDATNFDKNQLNDLLKLVEDEMRSIVEMPTIP